MPSNPQYFQDRAGKWRFRIVGKNGEKVMTSEAYASKGNAQRGFLDLRSIIDMIGED